MLVDILRTVTSYEKTKGKVGFDGEDHCFSSCVPPTPSYGHYSEKRQEEDDF